MFITYYPFTSKWLDAQFDKNLSEYSVELSMVEDGILETEPDNIILHLPGEYEHLSARDREIFFYIDEGVTSISVSYTHLTLPTTPYV